MGIRWGLVRFDNLTGEDLEERFKAEPWNWAELDLALVGNRKGPATRLMQSVEGDNVVSQIGLSQCDADLRKIKSIPAINVKSFVRGCFHSIRVGDEEDALRDAAESARQFRAFISRANAEGWKIRLWTDLD